MRSLDEFAWDKLAALERAVAPRAGGNRTPGHLRRAQRPPLALVLVQRLSQPYAASGDRQSGRSRPQSATASAPAPRASSPATIRSMPNWRAGWLGSRPPRPPACSAPVISPISASSPALAGPDDLILVDELSHACISAGAKLCGASVRRYRHCDVAACRKLLAAHRGSHPQR